MKMRDTTKRLYLLTVLAATAVLLGYSHSGKQNPVQQDQRVPLRVGYSSGAFSKGFLSDAQAVLESLGTRVAEKATDVFSGVSAMIYDDFKEFGEAIAKDEVDLVILSSLDYLTLEPRGILEPVLVGSTSRGILREYVLLVSKDRNIKDMSQLERTTLLIETGGSGRTPLVWFEIFFKHYINANMDSFFKEIVHVDKASKAVLPVFFHNADACVTTLAGFQTMVELNPQLGQKLNILYSSPKLLRGIACFRTDFEERYKSVVMSVLKDLHEDPDGQQILIVMREEKLSPFRPQYLETSRELYRSHQSLKANH